jgi:hypothetical protein
VIIVSTRPLLPPVDELKTGGFEPASFGHLGFDIMVVDDRMRREIHRPTAEILICGGPYKYCRPAPRGSLQLHP